MKTLIALAASCTLATLGSIAIGDRAAASEDLQFVCAPHFDRQTGKRFPTTFALNQGGKRPIIVWKFKWINGAVSPEQRCQQVSARLQIAYNNGSLDRGFITNSRVRGQRVICTAYRNRGACDVVLLTLRPSDDPYEILTTLKEALKGRGSQPLIHSSGERQIYYQIDINKLLATTPVEEETSTLVTQSNANEVTLHLQQALDYLKQGKDDLALAQLNRAIELDPTNELAYMGRATIYVNQKQWNLALDNFDRAIKFDSQLAVAYFGRGIVRLQLADRPGAVADLNTAAQLYREQKDANGYQKVTQILKELGE